MNDHQSTMNIIIPFLNEEQSLPALVDEIKLLIDRLSVELKVCANPIFIDDGSTDDGHAVLAQLLIDNWRIIRLSRNFGKEIAVLAGLDSCRGDLVMIMDADLQHSADLAFFLVAELKRNPSIDVVFARATRVDVNRLKGWAADAFYRFINTGQRFNTPASGSDFRVMRNTVARALASIRDQRRFNKGLYAWAGFRQLAVDYQPQPRAYGTSKWGASRIASLSFDGITSFSVMPLRAATGFGLLVAFAGLIYGAKILFEVFAFGIAVPGYPSLLVAVVGLGGCNLMLVGLVGEYVWTALIEAKRRPVYIVRDIL